jgi:putative DNA primase/helicase
MRNGDFKNSYLRRSSRLNAASATPRPPKRPDINDLLRQHGPEKFREHWDRNQVDAAEAFGVQSDIKPKFQSPKGTSRQLLSRRASEITPKDIDFIWNGRLARGKHTCIGGEPGVGKSTVAYAIIAAITTGGMWPCGEGQAPIGNVIILSAEDDPDDTIVPRLMAAGADRDRIHIVTAVTGKDGKGRTTFSLQNDLDLLEQKIDEIGDVALVVIDPVSSYLGKTDSHKNSEVRGILEPISEMAARKRVAILSVTHFSKNMGSTKALHRFIGSIAFVGAPRAAFAVIEDPDNEGRMLFLHAKNNMTRPPQGLAYRLEQRFLHGLARPVSNIVWESEPVSMTANQALAAEAEMGEKKTAIAEAEEFLSGKLADGPAAAKDIGALAEAAMISKATLRRAKARLNVVVMRAGFGPGSEVMWSSPIP